MKYRVLRSCFVNGQIYLKDEVHEIPDSMRESTKFQPLGEVVEPTPDAPETQREPKPGEFLCSDCGRVCKSAFGLQSHMRAHQSNKKV